MKINNINLQVGSFLLLLTFIMYSACNDDDPDSFPEPKELLINPTMDVGSSTPYRWFSGGAGEVVEHSWTTEEYISPPRSLKMSAIEPSDSAFAFYGQSIRMAIPHGKDLIFNVNIKCIDIVGDGVAIAIRCDDSTLETTVQFESTEGQNKIEGTFDWTNYSVKLINVDANVDQVLVFLLYLNNTSGAAYFDDASLVKEIL